MRLIVGISGASGAILGIRLLQALQQNPQCQTYLIISNGAKETIEYETEFSFDQVLALADIYYEVEYMAAPIASGSFKTDGMVIVPCSMKTVAGIVSGYADNLLLRVADVCLKEQRQLILVPRESPLNIIHCENIMKASRYGCKIIPPMLTFYNHPQTIDDMIDHIVGKIMNAFNLDYPAFKPWTGA